MFGTGYHYGNPYNNGSFYVMGLPDTIASAKAKASASHTSSSSFPNDTGTSGSASNGGGGASTNGTKNGAAIRIGENTMVIAIYPVALLTVLMFLLG